MGITSFLENLEMHFLNQLKDQDIPSTVDVSNWNGVEDWFRQAFAQWFLENREHVLSWEWVRRGWADYVLRPSTQGKLQESYRVKPEFLDEIDSWLQDQID
jgi:hypothetical protein